jgi:hypothetical protein
MVAVNTSATQTTYAAANISVQHLQNSVCSHHDCTCVHFLLLMTAVLCCVTVLAYRFTNKRVTIINSSPLFAKTVCYASGTSQQPPRLSRSCSSSRLLPEPRPSACAVKHAVS